MPNPTYKLINSYEVGSGGAASIDFTSIPSTYTDLVLKISVRNTAADTENSVSFNGSSTGFTIRRLYGNGSVTGSDTLYGYFLADSSGYTASTFSNNNIYIPNYAGSTNKSFATDGVAENNGTNNAMVLSASLWSNTAAITRITLTPLSGTYAQYSSAQLYGIKNS